MVKNENNFRKYGEKPFKIITLHGGPGALGELKELSIELGKIFGVIEYLQTMDSINSLLIDLKKVILSNSDYPLQIVGFSWGAWLGTLFSAANPDLVENLILISSAPFNEENNREVIYKKRINRMNKNDREIYNKTIKKFNREEKVDKILMDKFFKVIHKVDSYKFFEHKDSEVNFQINLYNKIWNEASKLRKDGKLVKALSQVKCPINVIHGDYDPHPFKGVIDPLRKYNKKYNYTLLNKCGHIPWKEKYAKEKFYSTLIKYLN